MLAISIMIDKNINNRLIAPKSRFNQLKARDLEHTAFRDLDTKTNLNNVTLSFNLKYWVVSRDADDGSFRP